MTFDKPKFTLDTNCLIAVAEGRPEALAIKRLLASQVQGTCSVAVVAVSASEKQLDGKYLENFEHFQSRLKLLGFGGAEILLPLMIWGVGYWGHGLWGNAEFAEQDMYIHKILFPEIELDHTEFCAKRGYQVAANELHHKWRNAKCDVQAFWSHSHNKRTHFVTSDKNFHASTKRTLLEEHSQSSIVSPEAAAMLLPNGAA